MIEQNYNGHKFYISEEWNTPEWKEKARKLYFRYQAMYLLGLEEEDFEEDIEDKKTISNI